MPQSEITPHLDAQNFPRAGRFLHPSFGVAARPGLAAREVENAGAVAGLGHLEHRAAAGKLDVVRMRRDRQQIEFHSVSDDCAPAWNATALRAETRARRIATA